ncbi:MAG: CdaR family transcriptional regulator [Psychromonas sp.]|nr:CdaR family transcriptional regulator [Psychromonas sp.]
MFLLENHIAQQIVDRTMAIIGNNINVMNHAGIIIGSGDQNRIGEKHDGALLALQRGCTVEIDQQTSRNLKGALPGINLVLKIQEQIIGVVGITGDPDECRNYANLVKMSAEMIVEQASLTEQLQWDRRHREEFISSWINNKQKTSELLDWAKRLDIDMSAPRVAVVIRFRNCKQPMSLKDIRKVVELLEYPKRDNLVAVQSMNEMVVLKPVTFNHGKWDSTDESRRIDLLLARLKENKIQSLDIALGHFFEGDEAIALSYQSAKLTLAAGRFKHSSQHKHLYDQLRLPVLLSPLKKSWQGEQLCTAFKRLEQADNNGQLVKTLITLFESEHSQVECANKLFIHRNTLRYRIKRIHEISKVDPEKFSGLMELYIGYLLKGDLER